MTSKENTAKLKDLGVAPSMQYCPGCMHLEIVYDAETLFSWLSENTGKGKRYPYSYYLDDEDGIMLDHTLYGDSNDPLNTWDSPAFAFKTSLADILAEAIIWILEQP